MKRYPKPQKYTLKNPKKYVGNKSQIIARSSWERIFMIYCDTNPRVLQWGSEIYPIKYISKIDNKIHRYFVDFFIEIEDKYGRRRKLAIEIKPFSQTQPPKNKSQKTYLNEMITYQTNQDKWAAAKEWAKKNGFEFVIFTEYELGIKRKSK